MVSSDQSEFSFVDRLEELMPEMRAFARSLCRDATLADDLVQEACLKAWSSADSFDQTQPMRPWIFRILRNEYYMQMRRSWRSVHVDSGFLEAALVEDASQEVSQDFDRLQVIINDLPTAQRDAVLLVVAAGMTYEEAGEVCNCSAGTVKSRVSRAKDIVKTRFQSDEGFHTLGADGSERGMGALLARIDDLMASVSKSAA